jgi:hypothetical protein
MEQYCSEYGLNSLLKQWDFERNGTLTPKDVTYGSRQKVWWICENGHPWQAAVYTRTGAGAGCPYCSGKRVIPGENDLASQLPEVAAQWHPQKNCGLSPQEVSLGSHKKVWWICKNGHQWQATVKTRVSGHSCPICSNQTLLPGFNDLATTKPDLAQQWHPEKNGSLTPEKVMAGTNRKVWWQCEKGHEWQASVSARAKGSGCPVCAGKKVVPGENDLASRHPEIAAQWNAQRNGTLRPEQVTPASNRKVWWRCPLGHEYQAAIGARTVNGSGCPYCTGRKVLAGFNDLATLEPKVAAQWHPTLNGTLTPAMVTVGSRRKTWWRCPEGHVWKAVISSRAGSQKCSCPICAGKVRASRRRYVSPERPGQAVATYPRPKKGT